MARALTCPGCRAAMVERTDDDVTVHACEECGSFWLSEGDLENKGVSMPPHVRFLQPADPRMCPDCGHAMGRLRARGVELDRCAPCGGIYFDRGELERMSGQPVESAPSDSGSSVSGVDAAIDVAGVLEVLGEIISTLAVF